jgi:hypothetical protein
MKLKRVGDADSMGGYKKIIQSLFEKFEDNVSHEEWVGWKAIADIYKVRRVSLNWIQPA